MTTRATPAATQSPPSPPDDAIPYDLIIARWIDTGDFSYDGDGAATLGALLDEMWVIATRLGPGYFSTILFTAQDGRPYAVEGCVFTRRVSREAGKACGQRRGVDGAQPTNPPGDDTITDSLCITDLFCPGSFNPAHARTVGELKRAVWRNILRTFGDAPPVRPVAFIGEDEGLYVVEFGLRVRPASATKDRAAIEWEQGFLRDEAADRIAESDRYLERMGA